MRVRVRGAPRDSTLSFKLSTVRFQLSHYNAPIEICKAFGRTQPMAGRDKSDEYIVLFRTYWTQPHRDTTPRHDTNFVTPKKHHQYQGNFEFFESVKTTSERRRGFN